MLNLFGASVWDVLSIYLRLGLLAGPSGIRAGWVIETKSRLGAE